MIVISLVHMYIKDLLKRYNFMAVCNKLIHV